MAVRDKVDGDAPRPELPDVLNLFRRAIELGLRVSMPGHVTAYDPATQRATVQLGLLPVRFVEGEEVPDPPLVLPQIPVAWPGGSLGYVTTPLLPGDTGLVVFSDRCMSLWLLNGGPTDPVNGRTHELGDGVFVPGLRNATNPIAPPTALDATVVHGPLVRLGATGTEFALRGTALAATALSLSTVLAAVPPATDPATVITLANANTTAILGLLAAIQTAVSATVQVQ